MDFFDKMKEALIQFSKTSAEAAREGVEKLGEKATEFSNLSKIKMEMKALELKINKALTELGNEYYNLYVSQKQSELTENLKKLLKTVEDLKREARTKEIQLKEVYQEYTRESLEKEKIKAMQKELESGGGTIEQIFIQHDSPVLGKKLKSIRLPKEVLVGTILRQDEIIIPDGDYIFQNGDRVTLLGKNENVKKAIEKINPSVHSLYP